ncbi:hypothetical protein ACQY0O_002419 [Thecaphora frezii]
MVSQRSARDTAASLYTWQRRADFDALAWPQQFVKRQLTGAVGNTGNSATTGATTGNTGTTGGTNNAGTGTTGGNAATSDTTSNNATPAESSSSSSSQQSQTSQQTSATTPTASASESASTPTPNTPTPATPTASANPSPSSSSSSSSSSSTPNSAPTASASSSSSTPLPVVTQIVTATDARGAPVVSTLTSTVSAATGTASGSGKSTSSSSVSRRVERRLLAANDARGRWPADAALMTFCGTPLCSTVDARTNASVWWPSTAEQQHWRHHRRCGWRPRRSSDPRLVDPAPAAAARQEGQGGRVAGVWPGKRPRQRVVGRGRLWSVAQPQRRQGRRLGHQRQRDPDGRDGGRRTAVGLSLPGHRQRPGLERHGGRRRRRLRPPGRLRGPVRGPVRRLLRPAAAAPATGLRRPALRQRVEPGLRRPGGGRVGRRRCRRGLGSRPRRIPVAAAGRRHGPVARPVDGFDGGGPECSVVHVAQGVARVRRLRCGPAGDAAAAAAAASAAAVEVGLAQRRRWWRGSGRHVAQRGQPSPRQPLEFGGRRRLGR